MQPGVSARAPVRSGNPDWRSPRVTRDSLASKAHGLELSPSARGAAAECTASSETTAVAEQRAWGGEPGHKGRRART
eukprot:3200744-Prymnesium_polylepis.1